VATVPERSSPWPVVYPESDGKPMAETEAHRDAIIDLLLALQWHFADDDTACVSGNMLMYYAEGNPRKSLAPDVFVALGVGVRPRRTYKVWEEGKGPDLVIEVTSPATRREDSRGKFAIYRDVLRVREYVLFDQLEEYLKPSLQGFRLVEGRYEPIGFIDGWLPSAVTGLLLERDGQQLRLVEPATGRRLATPREARMARLAAEEEVRRLKAENDERRRRLRELKAKHAALSEQLRRMRRESSSNDH
jgi:Uma2 family endonuclease